MKFTTLFLMLLSLNSFGALITTNSDKLLIPASGCISPDAQKKTIVLVDYTVENKEALASAVKELEYKIGSFYNGDNKEFLLNHKFEYSRIDDSGEHSAEWAVQTPKIFGNHSTKLQESLTDLNINIENSLKKIKEDKKKYKTSLIIEQIAGIGKSLENCDHLIVISDLLLVDKEGNNFERGIFTAPTKIVDTKGQIVLFRVSKSGQKLKEIKKVEAWWDQSINGGNSFTSSYSIKNNKSTQKHIEIETKVLAVDEKKTDSEEDEEGDSTVSLDKAESIQSSTIRPILPEITESKPSLDEKKGLDLTFESSTDNEVLEATKIEKIKENPIAHKRLAETEQNIDDEEFGCIYLGIDMNQLLNESPKNNIKKVDVETPIIPTKKVVDVKLVQLACDEFRGRLLRDAFNICKIEIHEVRNSKLELSLNSNGQITSYLNELSLPPDKLSCLSGYVASRPVTSVGADFTCRVLIQ